MFDDFVQTITQNADEEKAESRRIEAQRAQATAESRARLEQSLAERKKEYETFKQKQGEAEAVKPPVFQPPPTPPNTQEMVKPSSLEKTMGVASIFALLSVGIAKGQAIYGLKAFSGFMQGAHAGNLEQAKASIDDYKNSMEQVRQANEQAEREYLNIFNNKKLSVEQAQQAVHLKALEFKDESFLESMKIGDIDKQFEFLKDRRKTTQEAIKDSLHYQDVTAKMANQAAHLGIAQERLQIDREKIGREKSGKVSPTQERQELTTLIKTYENDAKAAQKKIDSHKFFSAPQAEKDALKEAQANLNEARNRLKTLAGYEGTGSPAPKEIAQPGSKLIGKTAKGELVYERPDGSRFAVVK